MTRHIPLHVRTICVLIILLFGHALCFGEALPKKLTVAEAVDIAMRSNARLKESQAGYLDAASRLKVNQFKTTYDLNSRASVRRSDGESDTATLVTGNWEFKGLTGTQATVGLSPYGSGGSSSGLALALRHPLGSGRGAFSDKADAVRSAIASLSLQDRSLFLTTQSIVQNVIDAYYTAVLAREKVKVVEDSLAIAKQAASDARARLREQLIVAIDVSRADIRVAQTEDQLNQQRQTARSTVDQLMLSMGLGIGQSPQLVDPVPDPVPTTIILDDAVKKALANRAELAQYDVRIAEQERQVGLRGDSMRPRLDAVAGLDTRDSDEGLLSTSITDSSTLTAGIELRIPLDRRSLAADRETAVRDLQITKAQRALEAERVAQEIRNAFRNLEQSKATLDIFTENLAVAEKSLTLATRMFEEGLRDNRNVLDAQQDIARIKNDILGAKTDLYLAGLNLRYAMGEDLTATEAK